jgi:hypothetical protein
MAKYQLASSYHIIRLAFYGQNFSDLISTQSTLNDGIATFYDESSGLWESMWGEHMHHGYYSRDAAPKSNQDAQIDMIEEVLKWAGAIKATKVQQRPVTTSPATHMQQQKRSMRCKLQASWCHQGFCQCNADGGCGVWHWRQQQIYIQKIWVHSPGHYPESCAGAHL